MERSLYYIMMSVIVIMVFMIIYGKNGFMDVQRLKQQEQTMIDENSAINEQNEALERKVSRLKGDLGYIEHIARHELGMVSKDELVFRFQDIIKDESTSATGQNSREQ